MKGSQGPAALNSRTKLSWFTSYDCTVAAVQLYSCTPPAGPNNRFLRPLRVSFDKRRNSQKLSWAGVWTSGAMRGEYDIVLWSVCCCPVSNSQHSGTAMGVLYHCIRQPALARLDSGSYFLQSFIVARKARICSLIGRFQKVQSAWYIRIWN